MKWTRLLFLTLLCASSVHAQYGPNWKRLAQFGTGKQFISTIYFVNDDVGFVGIYGSTSGCIQRTTDGGQNWQPCITPILSSPVVFSDFCFQNPLEGWVAFWFGTNNLWHTTDGGITWNPVASFPTATSVSVRQTSQALSITSAGPSGIYVSTNNGASFQRAVPTIDQAGMDFVDDMHGVSAGYYQTFSVTSNGGLSWTNVAQSPLTESYGVYGIPGSSTFFVAPEDVQFSSVRNVLRSNDYGQTWNTLPLPPRWPTGDIKGIASPNGVLLYIQSRLATLGVYRSDDMGNTWRAIGGPNNFPDTRIFVQQCGNKIFVGDTNCALWVTYNGGDGTQLSCSVQDSMTLIAPLCDSLTRLHFLHNPHPGDSVYIVDARIVDSTPKVITSRAFGFDSIPPLSHLLAQSDSMGFLVHWKPRRITDTAITARTSIQFITIDKKTGVVDTILIPITLFGFDVLPHFASTTFLNEYALACEQKDTVITLQNLECDTLWIISDRFSQNTNWSLRTTLPFRILPGQTASISIRLLAITPKLDDTLRLSLHYLRHDTSTTVYLGGSAYARDPFSAAAFVYLDSVLMCATTDTLLSLLDTLCGSMSISSIRSDSSQWAFYNANRDQLMFPLSIQKTLGFPLRVEYTPKYLQENHDTLRVTYHYFDSTFIRAIPLRGSAKASSGFDYAHVYDLGPHSICAPFDTTITLQNQTCAESLIDNISVLSAFEFLDTFPLRADTNGFVTLHIRFSPKAAQNYNATATLKFTEYNLPANDTLLLTGTGIITPPTFTITSSLKTLDLLLSECDAPDTIQFDISNPSCDSLLVQSMTVNGLVKGVIAAKVDRSIPFELGGTKTAHVTIATSQLKPGSYNGDLLFHLDTRDTLIPINVTIKQMPRTVLMDTTPIDLGTLKPCETLDIAIPYTNTSCTFDTVKGWTLSSWTEGFNVFGSGQNPPYLLKPDTTDTLHITFDGHHIGILYDTVIVGFTTDDNQTRRIPVKTFVPNIDSVLFTIRMPAKLGSNQEFIADVLPDRSVTGKDIYTISGNILYPANDLDYISILEGTNLRLTSSAPLRDSKTDKIRFVLSNPSGITLDPTIPVLTLRFRTLLTDTISYSIALDSMVLNGSDPDFANCTLGAGGTQSMSAFEPVCSDSLFITALRGGTLLLASDPTPNPANSISTLHLQSIASGSTDIEVRDALGRAVQKQSLRFAQNSSNDLTLDASAFSAGAYTIAINFMSSSGGVHLLRRLLIIH